MYLTAEQFDFEKMKNIACVANRAEEAVNIQSYEQFHKVIRQRDN